MLFGLQIPVVVMREWPLRRRGSYRQFIYIAPDANAGIVKLSHWPEPWIDDLESETYAFFEAVLKSLR